MFVAQYDTTCRECQRVIAKGQLARSAGTDVYIHHECPPAGVVGATREVKANNYLGKVACDAYGNVMAVMTERGWEDVDDGRAAEVSLAGSAFPLRAGSDQGTRNAVVQLVAIEGGGSDRVPADQVEVMAGESWRDGW